LHIYKGFTQNGILHDGPIGMVFAQGIFTPGHLVDFLPELGGDLAAKQK
jgi:hypothetical protein